jgi:hypothetical protein
LIDKLDFDQFEGHYYKAFRCTSAAASQDAELLRHFGFA